MKQVWKGIMHLNAKVFCLIAAVLFVATVGWCMYQYMMPLEPIKDGTGRLPEAPEPLRIGILDFVTNQLAGDGLAIPVEPFRPTAENSIRHGETPGVRPNNVGGTANTGNKNILGNQSGNTAGSGAGAARMITPKISFLGFVKTTQADGSTREVAQFMDSSDKSIVFYTPGKTVHGLEILEAGMKEAIVKFPDGSVGKIPYGGSVELAQEPDPNPPPPPPPPPAKPAARR